MIKKVRVEWGILGQSSWNTGSGPSPSANRSLILPVIRHYELMKVRTNDPTKDSLNVNEQTDKKCCRADPPSLLKDRKHLGLHIGHTHCNQDSRRRNASKYLENDMRENFLKWPNFNVRERMTQLLVRNCWIE